MQDLNIIAEILDLKQKLLSEMRRFDSHSSLVTLLRSAPLVSIDPIGNVVAIDSPVKSTQQVLG
jgi:hypothetical protein